jgi:hypothetical protein
VSPSDLLPADSGSAHVSEVAITTAGPTWQDQDTVLRELWMQNKTPQEISDILNRSIPAIMTRAARLGLPRRSAPGRKPGRRALDDNGVVRVPAAPRSSVRSAPRETEHAAAPQTSLRTCLMCLTHFESVGRHNRICSSCKGSSEYESASALAEIHMPAS